MSDRVLGLIPARSGSKGIPHKNIAPLAGRPLLAYTCQAARASLKLDRVILNTDSQQVADVGIEYSVDVPFLRPAELAGDDTPILPVIQHSLRWLEDKQDEIYDIIVLLQPTSPLRGAHHIDAALELLLGSDADTVVSVQVVPHNFTPGSLMQLDQDGSLKPLLDGEMVLRRQEKPVLYARNGPAVLAVMRSVIDSGRLYGDHILPYEMSALDSIDIDTETDLLLAEAVLALKRAE